MYGTEAANGVILITTKSGARTTRPAEWTVWSERGRITEPNEYPANYSGKDAAGNTCLLTSVATGACTQARVDSFNLLMDPTTTPFNVGFRNVLGTSVAGGRPEVKYYVSGDYLDEVGVYRPVDGISKINARANLNLQPTEKIQLQVNAGYVQSLAKLFADGGTVIGFITNGLVGGACNTCWSGYSPQQLRQIDAKQRVGRFIGSTMAQYQPATWLQLRGQFGTDALNQQDDRLIPIGALPARNPTGERTVGKNSGLRYNADALARIEWPLSSSLNTIGSFGAQYLSDRFVEVTSLGTGLAPGSNSLAAAGQITTTERTTESKTLGAYFEGQLAFRDRLFLTAGLRTDQNSSFGKQFESIIYPKVGLSWVLSDETFFPEAIPTSSLRLRFAWGQSGSQPGALNAVTYYGTFPMTTPEGTTQSGVTFQTGNLGNPALKPERSSEVEGGFDVGFLNERVTAAITYYRKVTSDALVNRAVAPSVGATSGRWENLSEVENKGWEALLSAGLYERDNVSANVVFNLAYNKNKLLESGLPHVNGSSFTQGYPLGAYWSRTISSYADANGDGIIVPGEITVTDTSVFLGEVIPPLVASVQPTLTLFKRLRTSAVFAISNGAWLYNSGERMRCQGGQARPRSDRSTSLDEQARCVAAAALGVNGGMHHDASFTKLRELSFSYDLPQSWLAAARLRRGMITLAGQNLFTWTDYPGIDPDISSRGSNFSTIDYLQPASRRVWLMRVNANF
jgi:outer membrane receptor protein involved in Fe transport